MSLEIRKILCPTDFSAASRQVLGHALFLAEKLDAEIHMLNALVLHEDDPSASAEHFVEPAEIFERLFEISGSRLKSLLDDQPTGALTIHEVTRRGFSIPEVILDYAEEIEADLIAMGTHGRRGARRFFLGSVAESVVRHADCPVLTLKAREHPGKIQAVANILVPVDFSEPSREALLVARDLAAVYGARLQLLYVVEMTAYPYFYVPTQTEVWENRRTRGREALARLAAEVLGEDVPYETFVVDGRAAREIARFCSSGGADLIVIASQGLGAVGRLLMGSTAAEVVRTVDCPVLTVRPDGRESASAPAVGDGGERAKTA